MLSENAMDIYVAHEHNWGGGGVQLATTLPMPRCTHAQTTKDEWGNDDVEFLRKNLTISNVRIQKAIYIVIF